ncbi:AAA family ATPase [Halomonas sp.]|uniref:AAA family ATPase n=1 Tax=Halomonas sp. TaxID=1486246 RepID=UPI002580002C|nr:AAA family ATPase [Halomonas sp.]MCJ8285131.1 AAA family ATPase [Halomonas sp.]NQY70181.1 AAA family ATPase [Halomonas sp.]
MSDKVTQLDRKQTDPALLAEVRQAMKDDELSQPQLSQLTGVNKTRLNHWLNDKYSGQIAPIEDALRRWLDSRRDAQSLGAQLPEAPEWVETPSARAVLSALSFAQMAGAVSVIYGGAGVGKTLALGQYRRQAPNVWVVTATPAASAPGPILARIAQTLGIRASGAVHVVESSIIERLRDTRGLLVIDEAQHLNPRALDQMRQVAEGAGIGLALVGNEVVYAQLTGGNRSIGFAQLFSRIAKRVRLTRPKAADIDALLDAWGIGEAASRQVCHEIGRRPGALRGLSQTLRLASMFAGGSRPGVEHIRAAWQDLGGES